MKKIFYFFFTLFIIFFCILIFFNAKIENKFLFLKNFFLKNDFEKQNNTKEIKNNRKKYNTYLFFFVIIFTIAFIFYSLFFLYKKIKLDYDDNKKKYYDNPIKQNDFYIIEEQKKRNYSYYKTLKKYECFFENLLKDIQEEEGQKLYEEKKNFWNEIKQEYQNVQDDQKFKNDWHQFKEEIDYQKPKQSQNIDEIIVDEIISKLEKVKKILNFKKKIIAREIFLKKKYGQSFDFSFKKKKEYQKDIKNINFKKKEIQKIIFENINSLLALLSKNDQKSELVFRNLTFGRKDEEKELLKKIKDFPYFFLDDFFLLKSDLSKEKITVLEKYYEKFFLSQKDLFLSEEKDDNIFYSKKNKSEKKMDLIKEKDFFLSCDAKKIEEMIDKKEIDREMKISELILFSKEKVQFFIEKNQKIFSLLEEPKNIVQLYFLFFDIQRNLTCQKNIIDACEKIIKEEKKKNKEDEENNYLFANFLFYKEKELKNIKTMFKINIVNSIFMKKFIFEEMKILKQKNNEILNYQLLKEDFSRYNYELTEEETEKIKEIYQKQRNYQYKGDFESCFHKNEEGLRDFYKKLQEKYEENKDEEDEINEKMLVFKKGLKNDFSSYFSWKFEKKGKMNINYV